MNKSSLMSQDFRDKVNALRDKYQPIEFDHSLPVDQKIHLMVEWYQKRKDIVIASKISKSQMEEMSRKSSVVLRDGVKESLALLHEKKIPCLIFSAGIGDIIEGVLKKDDELFPKSHVISNFFKYDKNGYVIDYMNPTLLHV
jgi:5'-nucleotidase